MRQEALQRTKGYFVGGLTLSSAFVILSLTGLLSGHHSEGVLVSMFLLGLILWVMTLTNLTEAKGYPRALGLISITLIGALVLAVLPDKNQELLDRS